MFDETSPSLSHFLLLQMMVIIFKINVRDKLVGHILAIGPRLCSPQLKLGWKTLVNNSIYPPWTQENLSFVYQVSYHKSSVRLYIPLNHIIFFPPFLLVKSLFMGHHFVRFGLQYILASRGLDGTTQPLQLQSDCIGNGEDPLAKTFQQVSPGFDWRWRFTMYLDGLWF